MQKSYVYFKMCEEGGGCVGWFDGNGRSVLFPPS